MKRIAIVISLGFIIPAVAHGGILVMKNGNVFQGRIRALGVNNEYITMRWPYKDFRGPNGGDIGRGYKKFERNRIRWYSLKKDDLTDDYFETFDKEILDARFHNQRELWREQKKGEDEIKIEEITPLLNIKRGPGIVLLPTTKVHFDIRKPEGWTTKDVPINRAEKGGDSVFTIVSKEQKKGFAARIHIVSVPRPKVSMAEQKHWYKEEVERLSQNRSLEFREQAIDKSVGPRRKDTTMTTVTRVGKQLIVTLRFIKFRRERVYFITCYAHEDDFSKLRKLFNNCVNSMNIFEDERGE
jgi:hypothetical protein